MNQTVFTHNRLPKVGIMPIIDGRHRGVSESLEDQTMSMCANKFRDNNVGVLLSVTPCLCYGTETIDLDQVMPETIWGFDGTERPGAVYLACMLRLRSARNARVRHLQQGRAEP